MAYTTINKSGDYFNTKLYAGNSGTQSITGVGFQPDFLWIKRRTLAGDHNLVDVIRTSDKTLISNSTGVEYSNSTITSFDSDGFSLSGSDGALNASSSDYASWNWLANGAGVSNTDGDVTSTVSVNTTSGFSIVKWDSTGTAGINIGHGLGQKPAMIIAKSTNISATSWPVYHQSLGATKYLSFNATTASTTSATRWNNSEPTTTTFQTGSSGDIGGSDRTMIAYCFAEKTGYSKFGSYVGNGNADGPFTYTGFKPAFIIVKPISGVEHWTMFDNKRLGYNPDNNQLYPNLTSPDATADELDILSNGFKIRSTTGRLNTNGVSHIYMAFAEAPLVGSNNIPNTAR